MLKRYVLRCNRTAAWSWQALPCATSTRLSILKLSTSCNKGPRKLNTGRYVEARAPIPRSYVTAAEAARSTEDDRPTVSLDLTGRGGNTMRIEIRPSYPHKPKAVENLLASLPGLLTDADIPISAIRTFTTEGWDLDESGDTIHRYVEVDSEQAISSILDQIRTASNELGHDPHVHTDGKQLTISCTTHVPPGLSMKDVKLAKRIDGILEGMDTAGITQADEADILTQRQRGREHNMDAIRKAKLDCRCG